MKEYYLKDPEDISKVLENAKMTETREDISKLSYNGETFIVPTNYLNRLMPSAGGYDDKRTIGSLTGIGVGTVVNANKGLSSYAKLSQTKDKKPDYYESSIPIPRKPKRKFGFD